MKSSDNGNVNRVTWHLILLAGLGIVLTWPAMWLGWPDLGHDSTYHPLWLEEFSKQFRAGEWYPRWLSDSNSGLGSPSFFYYTPLSYYLALPWLGLWSPPTNAAWHSLGLSSAFALIASGVIAYFWLIRWAGARGALWGAMIYMLMPWHTAIGLYNAGSWSSFCGFIWLPLALLGVDRLIDSLRGGLLLTALGYALLVFTHLPTAVLFSPLLLAYPFFLAPQGRRITMTLQTCCSVLLGLGIAAIYLVPALLQQDAVSLAGMREGPFFDYRKWYLGVDIQSIGDYKMRVLVVTLSMLVAAAAGYWLSQSVHGHGKNRTRMLFWLGVAAGCLFFMTQPSGFLWSTIGPLAAVQFPVRFNAILSLAGAVLWAGAAPSMSGSGSRWATLLACAFGLIWLTGTEWAAARAFLAWRTDPKGLERLEDSQRFKRDEFTFIPKWAPAAQQHGIEAPLANLPGRGLRLESATHDTASGSASIVTWEPRRIVLKVDTAQPARLLVGHFYFPGWQAQDLLGQQSLPLSPSSPDGLISVEVPAGTHQILLRLVALAPERAGQAISTASCLLVCLLTYAAFRRRPVSNSATLVANVGSVKS